MKTIELTQGKVTIVDDADFEELSKHKWYAHKQKGSWYVYRGLWKNGVRLGIPMHRQIMGNPLGFQVDHINGDRLDNRRCNLRLATNQQNCANSKKRKNNTSGFKGVFTSRSKKNPFKSIIGVSGKYIFLGQFPTAQLAHQAYIQAAKKYFGLFARSE